MSEDLGTAVLELRTDDKNLSKGVDDAQKKTSKSFGAIKTAAKVAAAGGIVALGFAIKDVVGDFLQGEKGAAQTAAVLKSTGDASHMTGAGVADLATKIRNYSGIQDDTIVSGENMLLTFTNIRNETGKGNDIFTQSTKTLADMSAALGEDMPKAAIQLGKALNDPVKGVTALSKVGVTFDDAQKKTIATMVKAGNTAGAQKVILTELHKEFGGSAAAAGKTLGGQLSILKGRLEDVSEQIVGKVIPYVGKFVTWMNDKLVPAVRDADHYISANLFPTLSMLWGIIAQDIIPFITKWVGVLTSDLMPILSTIWGIIANDIVPIVTTWAVIIATNIIPAFDAAQKLFQEHKTLIEAIGVSAGVMAVAFGAVALAEAAATIATQVWTAAMVLLDAVMDANPITLVVIALAALAGGLFYAYQTSSTFRAIVNQVWQDLQKYAMDALNWINNVGLPALQHAWQTIGPYVVGAINGIVTVAKDMVTWFRGNWQEIWSWVGPVIKTALDLVKGYFSTMFDEVKTVINTAGDIIHGRWSNIWDDLQSLVETPLKGVVNSITTVITGLGPTLERLGKAALQGLVTGLGAFAGLLGGWAGNLVVAFQNDTSDAINWLYHAGENVMQGLMNGITSKLDALGGLLKSVAGKVAGAFGSALGISSPSKVFYDFGTDTVNGLVNGIKDATARAAQTAKDLAAKTIQAARAPLQAGLATLSSDLSAAFSARQGDVQTPAEQALQTLQNQHDQDANDQALADAQAETNTAAAGDPNNGGAVDPAAVLQAQKDLADAQYNIKVASLTAQAAVERTNLDAQQTVQQQHFDAGLASLQNYLNSSEATTAGSQARIKAFTNKWGIDMADIGSLLGKGFQNGIESTQASLITSVSKLAAAIKKALKTGLEIKSPSAWAHREVGVPLVQGVAQGIQSEGVSIHKALKAVIPNPSTLINVKSGGAGGGGNHVELNQTFQQTPANADPTAIGAVTSFALRKVAT